MANLLKSSALIMDRAANAIPAVRKRLEAYHQFLENCYGKRGGRGS